MGPGIRVRMVVNRLRGEKIDVVPWSDESPAFVANALQPAKVKEVTVDPETQTALVIVPDYQLSLAIGREGQNARLAARLTGWRIDIKSESQAAEPVAPPPPPAPKEPEAEADGARDRCRGRNRRRRGRAGGGEDAASSEDDAVRRSSRRWRPRRRRLRPRMTSRGARAGGVRASGVGGGHRRLSCCGSRARPRACASTRSAARRVAAPTCTAIRVRAIGCGRARSLARCARGWAKGTRYSKERDRGGAAGSMRVHELAKELGVPSKELLETLEKMGVTGKSASSSVPEDLVPRLRASGGKATKAAKPRQVMEPPPKPRAKPSPSPRRPRRLPAAAAPVAETEVATIVAPAAAPSAPTPAPTPAPAPTPPPAPAGRCSRSSEAPRPRSWPRRPIGRPRS